MVIVNLSLALLAVSFVKCTRFVTDGQRRTTQLSDSTLNLGKGHSDIQCALRCNLKKKKQFMKDEEGMCFCDNEFKIVSLANNPGDSSLTYSNSPVGVVHEVFYYFYFEMNCHDY